MGPAESAGEGWLRRAGKVKAYRRPTRCGRRDENEARGQHTRTSSSAEKQSSRPRERRRGGHDLPPSA